MKINKLLSLLWDRLCSSAERLIMRWVDYDLQSVANHHKKGNNKSIISYYSVRPFCLVSV